MLLPVDFACAIMPSNLKPKALLCSAWLAGCTWSSKFFGAGVICAHSCTQHVPSTHVKLKAACCSAARRPSVSLPSSWKPALYTMPLVDIDVPLQQKKLKEQDVVESIILAERAILYTLAFQIKIELPQTCLFKNLEAVGVYTFSSVKGPTPESSLPTEQQQKLSQIAVNFANDR